MATVAYAYPVVFRCWECTLQLPSVEALEVHVWNRHLQTFPYRCALCGYPALTTKALAAHHDLEHGKGKAIEFKRKVIDELRLWQIVAQSIQVSLPQFDEEELYEDSQFTMNGSTVMPVKSEGVWEVGEQQDDGSQTVIMEGMSDASTSTHYQDRMQTMQHTNGAMRTMNTGVQEVQTQEVVLANGYSVPTVTVNAFDTGEVVLDDGIQEMNLQDIQDTGQLMLVSDDSNSKDGNMMDMAVVAEEEVVDEGCMSNMEEEGDILMDPTEPGTSYQFLPNGYLDEIEQVEYVDEHGNQIYLDDGEGDDDIGYAVATKTHRDIRMRMLKDRHMEMVVRKVADGKLRKTTPTVHRCEICGKVSKHPSKIAEHRRSHTGERPYKCSYCGVRFAQKGALKAHVRIHTGERPFSCTWECGKTFTSSSAQKLHEKTHSGERPYICGFCGMAFSKRYHAERHEKAIHSAELSRSGPVRTGLDAAEHDLPVVREAVLSVIDEVRQDMRRKGKLLHDMKRHNI